MVVSGLESVYVCDLFGAEWMEGRIWVWGSVD